MNEVHVDLDELGRVRLRRAGEGSGVYTLETTEALRAFFQAERDEQLGRWRDPENPNIVVYPIPAMNDQGDGYGRAVWVLDEAEMVSGTVLDDRHSHSSASHYFAAHPEPEPWDAAQPDCDEIWVMTINSDREEVFRCGENGLYSLKTGNPLGSLLSRGCNKITAGRRIWPEGEASE